MSLGVLPPLTEEDIIYPEEDGEPIAESTLQYEWIALIKGNLDVVFAECDDVFVAGDLFWYPVKGDPRIVQAPDTMVAFGRPKGHRRSYLQWREGGIAPQVVWEVLSESNRRPSVMEGKFEFYERYGVEEYYIYDPDNGDCFGWIRREGKLEPIANLSGWVSPRLGIRFEMIDGTLHLFGPDNKAFLGFVELAAQKRFAQRQAEHAQQKAAQAQQQAMEAQREKARLEHLAQEQAQLIRTLQEKLKHLGDTPES